MKHAISISEAASINRFDRWSDQWLDWNSRHDTVPKHLEQDFRRCAQIESRGRSKTCAGTEGRLDDEGRGQNLRENRAPSIACGTKESRTLDSLRLWHNSRRCLRSGYGIWSGFGSCDKPGVRRRRLWCRYFPGCPRNCRACAETVL